MPRSAGVPASIAKPTGASLVDQLMAGLQPQPPDPEDVDLAARTAFGEARGDPASLLGVIATILNRQRQGQWGDTVQEVVQAPKQYSSWNPGDPNRKKMLAKSAIAHPEFADIQEQVLSLMQGETADPTGGAEFYFNPDTAQPQWDFGKLEPTVKLGRHQFYKRKRRKKSSAA